MMSAMLSSGSPWTAIALVTFQAHLLRLRDVVAADAGRVEQGSSVLVNLDGCFWKVTDSTSEVGLLCSEENPGTFKDKKLLEYLLFLSSLLLTLSQGHVHMRVGMKTNILQTVFV